MLKKITATFLVLIAITGCTTSSSKLNEVSVGMTKSAVIQILGAPEAVSAKSGSELLLYGIPSNDFSDKFYVALFNGKVVEYGQGRREFN